MSTRYQVLRNEKQPLYAEGSPVIVCAKALTKDTAQNKVLAQIRFMSISKNMLTSLTVVLLPKDAAGRPINDEVQHAYLDLDAGRDSEFGADQAIYFNDETIRDYDVVVKECIYKNSGACQINKTLQAIQKPQALDGLDTEMIQQYREDIHCANAKYKYQDILDLWQCTCGKYNHGDEQVCHSCNVSRTVVQDGPDMQVLAEKIEQRKQEQRKEEQKIQEEVRVQKEEARKKQKKIAMLLAICAVIACVVGIAAKVAITNHINNTAKKEIETYISAGEYSDATNAIRGSKLSDTDKEDYFIQIVNALYQEGNTSNAKIYSDNIISDEGRDEIAQIQADYFTAGSFASRKEMAELKQICLDNGTISQEQADAVEAKAIEQYGWPTDEEVESIQKGMSRLVAGNKVPIDFLLDAKDKDIKFEDVEDQRIADTALSLFEKCKGIYTRIDESTISSVYIVVNSSEIYYGITWDKEDRSDVQRIDCNYLVDKDAIGNLGCIVYEDYAGLTAMFGGGIMPLREIDESELPDSFVEAMNEIKD